jgi:RNA polymerase sigma factor (sigma-70 family)
MSAAPHVNGFPDGRSRSPREQVGSELHNRHATPQQLLLAARSDGAAARTRLVETFMPLIGSVARIYAGVPGIDRAELMQEGVVGLLRALERYDPELGTPFWAYASWWVRQAMQQVVSELSRPVVLSDRALRQLARVRSARRVFVREQGREPSLRELADCSEVSPEQLDRLSVADRRPRALEERIDEPSGPGATFGESLPDQRAEAAYDELAQRLDSDVVSGLLHCLNDRQQRVIAARYGFGGPARTLRELGGELGVSAERVRQIEQAALEELRAAYLGDGHAAHQPVAIAS